MGVSAGRGRDELNCDLCDELDDGAILSSVVTDPPGVAAQSIGRADFSAGGVWLWSHAELLADSVLDVPAETFPENLNLRLEGSSPCLLVGASLKSKERTGLAS